ncbi:LOW QUALITY PROTEIN: somatostatin-1-like [Menidia menidia]
MKMKMMTVMKMKTPGCGSSSSSSARMRGLLLLLLGLGALTPPTAARRDPKLQLLLGAKQDSAGSSLADLLLSDLLQLENEALEEDGFPAGGPGFPVGGAGFPAGGAGFPLGGGDPPGSRLELERAAGGGPLLAPRERKAGCKNFFWKTFTSC